MHSVFFILGTIACMVVCGVVTFFVTVLVLMQLGLSLHGNYEHYGQNSWLVWGPAAIMFVLPAALAAKMRGGSASNKDS